MTTIIAFLLALGIITNAQEATTETINEYQQEYQESIIIVEDLDEI
jgi:hypothetical protein